MEPSTEKPLTKLCVKSYNQKCPTRSPASQIYDYGTGGIWAIVHARTAEEIEKKFESLKVMDLRPDFITDEVLDDIRQKFTFDIDRPEGWITQFLRQDG
jgi:predicted ATP-dependent Lon-type protease